MTENQTLSLLLALCSGNCVIIYGLNVWAPHPLSIWTKSQLKRKRVVQSITSGALLLLAANILVTCHQNTQLLFSSGASLPVSLLGFMTVSHITRGLKEEEPEFKSPKSKIGLSISDSSMTDKCVFVIVVTAILALTILVWIKM